MLSRIANLPKNKSFFLFGARQTGKSALIESSFHKETTFTVNLLRNQVHSKYIQNPSIFGEEIQKLDPKITHVFIDEIQRVPALLDEVHYSMMGKTPVSFIMTGSSARKLKRAQANLLAGRAWNLQLYPFVYKELPQNSDINQILQFGTLPPVWTALDKEEKKEDLRSYVDVYIKQEVAAEAQLKNLGAFLRFLHVAAQLNGEQLNFSNIGRDVGLTHVTAKEYFTVLEDALLGNFLQSFHFSERKRQKTAPKFYFFDTGVLRAAQQKLSLELTPATFEYGNYFETWFINEVIRLNNYLRKDYTLSFLRTSGNAEVDLILESPAGVIIAIEIKSKQIPIANDFISGFKAVKSMIPSAECICCCTGINARLVDGYEVLHFSDVLNKLFG